jgi:hypothetical protein
MVDVEDFQLARMSSQECEAAPVIMDMYHLPETALDVQRSTLARPTMVFVVPIHSAPMLDPTFATALARPTTHPPQME